MISFQIKPWVAFGLPYLLIELFYIGMPVVWTDNILGWTWRYGLQGGKGGEETNQLSLHGGLLSLIGFPLDKDPTPQSGY